MGTEARMTFFEGDYFDQDEDSIIGGYDEYANISPGNDYNINGDLEVIKCDIVHSKNYPCHAGSWTSVDNIITLTYDFSDQSFNYYVDQDGDYLTLQIEHIYTESRHLIGDVAEYQCRKVIRAKK